MGLISKYGEKVCHFLANPYVGAGSTSQSFRYFSPVEWGVGGARTETVMYRIAIGMSFLRRVCVGFVSPGALMPETYSGNYNCHPCPNAVAPIYFRIYCK